jgi:hypothetical protein
MVEEEGGKVEVGEGEGGDDKYSMPDNPRVILKGEVSSRRGRGPVESNSRHFLLAAVHGPMVKLLVEKSCRAAGKRKRGGGGQER